MTAFFIPFELQPNEETVGEYFYIPEERDVVDSIIKLTGSNKLKFKFNTIVTTIQDPYGGSYEQVDSTITVIPLFAPQYPIIVTYIVNIGKAGYTGLKVTVPDKTNIPKQDLIYIYTRYI